jgi:hypothetical protein
LVSRKKDNDDSENADIALFLSLSNPHVGVLLYSLAPDTAHFLAAMYTMQKPPMCIWLVKNMGLNMNYHF